MSNSVLAGFVSALSLIMAIGAQNAFVLRQGLRREHVATIVLICVLSDIFLIGCGVLGVGALIAHSPNLQWVARYGGAVFLLGYGALAARRAWSQQALQLGNGPAVARKSAIMACLGFTYLNPHVYLDTVVLLGSLASQHTGRGPLWFWLGACLASVSWFVALGYGARALTPLFAKARSWRVLDSGVALMMLGMGTSLLLT